MSGNTFGTLFTVTTFGESHGPALGCIVDGCPPGLPLTEEDIQQDVERRRSGTSRYTSQRREPDRVRILSGVFEGLTTGTPIRSAWICSSRLLAVAPPSTRSSVSAMPESAAIASRTSALWKAIASSVALARCALVVPRERPTMVPRACGSQYGDPSPESAGTKKTPPASGTLAASGPTSAEFAMIPRPSRSHCTAAPPTNTLPSRA